MTTYHRSIFFTKAPLTGYYKYKEVFQVFPANLVGMPAAIKCREFHFPNILEFWISDDEPVVVPDDLDGLEELHTLTARISRKTRLIFGLLTCFSNNLFFDYKALDTSWALPMPLPGQPREEMNDWSSAWSFQMYHFPQLPDQLKIVGFTDANLAEIGRKGIHIFYTDYPHLDTDARSPIILPLELDNIFDAYFDLDITARTIVDSAISHTVSAVTLHDSNKTLSLLASFTALEAMVDLENAGQTAGRCETCGQPRHSISAKFRSFLLKYIGDSVENKKKFNSLYTLRSKVVHAGRQLSTENLFNDVTDNQAFGELVIRIEVLQLGKMAVAGWLLRR